MHPLQQPSQHQSAQSARPVLRSNRRLARVGVRGRLACTDGRFLLYAVLAAEAPALGIPLVSVGLLLSANRFVRLITNSLAGAVYHRYGREWPYFLAMVASAFTTFAYGLPIGFAFFLLARLAWGTCWSFLNLGMYLSVLEHSDERTRGQWMGRIKSISRIGTIGGHVGSVLDRPRRIPPRRFRHGRVGAGRSCRIARRRAGCGAKRTQTDGNCPSCGGSLSQRRATAHGGQAADAGRAAGARAGPGAADDRWPNRSATADPTAGPTAGRIGPRLHLAFPGLYLRFHHERGRRGYPGPSRLAALRRVGRPSVPSWAATLSGLLLGVRWVAEIAWGPLAGAVGDRVGAERAVLVSAAAMAAGLAGLAWASGPHLLILLETGVFVAGVTLSVCLDSVVGRVAIGTNRVNKVMSLYVTAQDLGSALGPLVGYLVGVGVGLEGLYVGASLLLVFGALLSAAAHRRVA